MIQEKQLRDLLALRSSPIVIAFRDSAPAGVPRAAAVAPSGCSYWKLAAEGQVFYTEASDHFNCPVGAYTHNIDLPPEWAGELESLVGTMVNLEYIKREEISALPRLSDPFKIAIYAPLSNAPCEPDIILVRGNAKQIMFVAEAARAVGIGPDGATMGRPACAMVPEAIRSARGVTSLGCIGNRIYTDVRRQYVRRRT